MAQGPDVTRTPADVRREIDDQRAELAAAVDTLRRQATDVTTRVREKLPFLAGGALATGFLLSGGFGATMRLLARRGREGHEKARLGRFSVVDRD
jgi:hypothetical protein